MKNQNSIQIAGQLYWVEIDGIYKILFTEVEKGREQTSGPAVLIHVKNSLVTDVRIVGNLNKAALEANINYENRYFYIRINILKPESYKYILESQLTLLRHI